MKESNPAEIYNNKRRIIFSTFHKSGKEKAYEYLENYKSTLGNNSYLGLKAELIFYEKYQKEFSLTVTADVGDHSDFAGLYSNNQTRFDVTTNLDYKKLLDYEKFQSEGSNYKIVLMDSTSWDVKDIIDINFPFCPECGGRLLDIALLLPENLNQNGEPTATFDQSLISICSNNPNDHHKIVDTITTFYLYDYDYYISNAIAIDANDDNQSKLMLDQYSKNCSLYLKKKFNKIILGLASRKYFVINPSNGDGFWGTKMIFKDRLVVDYLFDEINTDLSS